MKLLSIDVLKEFKVRHYIIIGLLSRYKGITLSELENKVAPIIKVGDFANVGVRTLRNIVKDLEQKGLVKVTKFKQRNKSAYIELSDELKCNDMDSIYHVIMYCVHSLISTEQLHTYLLALALQEEYGDKYIDRIYDVLGMSQREFIRNNMESIKLDLFRMVEVKINDGFVEKLIVLK